MRRHETRFARASERAELVRMRTALWPDSTDAEVDELLGRSDEETAILVAERPEGGLCGYAEVGLRSFADGCATSPVGYLEGIWVDLDRRRHGVATALVEGAVAWARAQGMRELASDAALDNQASLEWHRAAGFKEAERVVCFRMSL